MTPGHRRISNALFAKYRPRGRAWTKIEQLVCLDEDTYLKGELRSLSAYADLWRVSRETVRRTLREYTGAREDLKISSTSAPPRDGSETDASTEARQRRDTHKKSLEPEPEPEEDKEAAASLLPPWGNLVNLLSDCGASPRPEPDEKQAWVEALWGEIEAGADADAPSRGDTRSKRNARIKRIALARWRTYLSRGQRTYRGAAERSREAEAKRRWLEEHPDVDEGAQRALSLRLARG